MEGRSPHTRSQTAIVLGLGVGQSVTSASGFYLMGALGDAIGRDLHLSATVIFSLVSLSLAVPAFTAPAIARRIDRRGGKPVLLASIMVLAAGLLLMASATDVWALAAGQVVIGLAVALGFSPTPFAILVSLYGEAARRPIIGVALISGLGSILGWPLSGWFAEALGWRGTCLLWAAIQICLCLPLVAWICPKTSAHAARTEADAAHPPVRWDRPMVQLAVLFACAWFVSTCMSAHLPRLLAAFGMSMQAATAAAGLMGVAAVTMRFLEFTVLRRLPPLATTRLATLLHPTGATALLALGAVGGPAMALAQGAGNGMLTVAKGVLPLSLYGPANYAYRSAILGRPALFAQIAGPAVFAVALERSATLAILGSSSLCLVMFAMTFGLRRCSPPLQKQVIA